MIISVGYRVNSHRGTQFRIWATQRLREYIIKGFTLDDERLKCGGAMNYFDELLARIRDIRSAEKVFYQKVKEIYATSIPDQAQSPAGLGAGRQFPRRMGAVARGAEHPSGGFGGGVGAFQQAGGTGGIVRATHCVVN